MGPLQAMDRSIAAAPLRNSPVSAPAALRLRLRLRLAALAFVSLLALAALLAPLLRGAASQRTTTPVAGSAVTSFAGLPASARAQASATLGAEQRVFAVTGAGAALHAGNPAEGFGTSFTRAGVRVVAAGIGVNLSLRTLGTGAEQSAVAAAAPKADANRVSYSRGALTEWYANGPAGLEQGFTVRRAPAGAATAPLTLTLGLSGGAHGTLSPDARTLMLRHGASSLRYGGLSATDANGRALHSWLSLSGGRLSIHVASAHARYPLRIDPLIESGNKLTGAGEQGEGLFGTSVALSADGMTLLVGAPHDANPHNGAVWVYTRSGSAFTQPGVELTGNGAASTGPEEEEQCAEESSEEAGECAFGASVALSADGNTALIGEPSATALPGSARVFKRAGAGAEWAETMTLPEGAVSRGGRFGKSVALSADGSTALVGDPSANGQRGSAWVFALSGASSTVQAQLSDPEAAHFDHFGRSVALSGDGSTALIGDPGDSEYRGSALVFTRTGGAWTRSPGKLAGEAAVGPARFGKSVALSGDGATALVGGPNDHENDGAAWGFTREGAAFVPQGGKLTGVVLGEAGHFGVSVALSNDGSVGLVGDPHASGAGRVTEVVHSGSSWIERPTQLAGAETLGRSWFGAAVSLASDGMRAAVGGPRDSARIGAAWAFSELPGAGPAITTVLPGFGPAGTVVRIKGSGFVGSEPAATKVSFGALPASSFVVKSAVLIEAVAPAGEGVVDLRVQTSEGLSAIDAGDTFRFTGGGSPGGPNKTGGGTTAPGEVPTTTTTTSGTGTKTPSGGVLGTSSSAGAACQVTLRSKRLAVTSYRTVALRLLRTGAGACSGKLTLNFRPKGKRAKLKTIGTASYSISSGTSRVFKITLNKAGRKLFRAHGGKLNVSLAIIRAVPAPRLAKSASVRLTWKKTHKAVTLTK